MRKVILFLDEAPGTTKVPTRQGEMDVPLDRPFMVGDRGEVRVYKVFEGFAGELPTAYARRL